MPALTQSSTAPNDSLNVYNQSLATFHEKAFSLLTLSKKPEYRDPAFPTNYFYFRSFAKHDTQYHQFAKELRLLACSLLVTHEGKNNLENMLKFASYGEVRILPQPNVNPGWTTGILEYKDCRFVYSRHVGRFNSKIVMH